MSLEIRPVREEDVEVVCGLIHALARYERLESHCKATSEQLREELFVVEDARRRGYGKAIIRHLAQKALDEGCGRFDWSVLDWNQPAIDFYEGLGAEVLPDWRICRLSGEALLRAAGR